MISVYTPLLISLVTLKKKKKKLGHKCVNLKLFGVFYRRNRIQIYCPTIGRTQKKKRTKDLHSGGIYDINKVLIAKLRWNMVAF